jgi:peptidoglycan/LPS O-acetylase OafA/YrhL
MKEVGINGGVLYAIGTIGLVAGALVIAWLMWHYVEEPAREWMRRRVGVRAVPVAEPVRELS